MVSRNPDRATVLVVDDNVDVLQALRRQLRHSLGGRARISVSNDAEQALSGLEDMSPEQRARCAIVLDYRLPGMTGADFVAHVRERFGPVPVVFLSGHISDDARREMDAEPMVRGILPKPWDESALAAVLADALALS